MRYNKGRLNLQKGFTLIELLVVVVIIGLLTTVATTNYMSSQAKARDGARKTQTNSIASAIETFYAVKKKFPGKGPVDSDYSADFKNKYAGCENVISSDSTITGTQKYFIEYSYKPLDDTNDNKKCNLRENLAGQYDPTEYSPFPTWIPEMGDYLSPAPVDKQYQSSRGKQGVNTDPHISLLDGNNNQTRTYTYIKLDSGYAIYTQLETSNDKDSLNGKIDISCKNAGLNFNSSDSSNPYCYTETTNKPVIPIKITNSNLYLVRR